MAFREMNLYTRQLKLGRRTSVSLEFNTHLDEKQMGKVMTMLHLGVRDWDNKLMGTSP